MSDFVYDSQDSSAMRVASKDLQKVERETLILTAGTLGLFLAVQYCRRHRPNSIWKSHSPLSLVTNAAIPSALIYSLVTWNSRTRYDNAAKVINKKYTSIISRTLNYQK